MATQEQRELVAEFLRGMGDVPERLEAYEAVAEELSPSPAMSFRDVVATVIGLADGAAGESATRDYRTHADAVLDVFDTYPGQVETPRKVRVGDEVRILQDRLEAANVRKGEVFRVSGVWGDEISAGTETHEWYFRRSLEGTGWELV